LVRPLAAAALLALLLAATGLALAGQGPLGILRGGELRVTVPLDWARARGYVAGFVQVVATTPGGYAANSVHRPEKREQRRNQPPRRGGMGPGTRLAGRQRPGNRAR